MIAMRAAVAAAYPIIAAAVTAERAAGDRRALDEARAKVAAVEALAIEADNKAGCCPCGGHRVQGPFCCNVWHRDAITWHDKIRAALAAAQPTESAPSASVPALSATESDQNPVSSVHVSPQHPTEAQNRSEGRDGATP